MKKFLKNATSKSNSANKTRMTVNELLRRLSETFQSCERRFYTRREAANLVPALRSALASPNQLLIQEGLTQECYRYLTLVNRTFVSGPSLIACLGADLPRQISYSSRLQAYAADLTDQLRSGKISPDTAAPDHIVELYLAYTELLSYSSIHFDVNIDDLESLLKVSTTYHDLESFIFNQIDANPQVPEAFIETFILAHAYLYRLSYLE